MDLSVFFAGTGGSLPSPRRGLPGILIRRGGERILVDCGEGTQRQLLRSIGLTDVDEILITHLHADHWLGLPGLLKTFDLRDRDRPLSLHGPRGLRDLVQGIMRYAGATGYDLYLVELEHGEVLERDGYEIEAVAVSHRGPALGYVLHEYERPGIFDPARARAAGLAEGPDFGRVQRGETVNGVAPEMVMGPPRPGRKLTISGDTRPCDALREAAHGSDVLIHEATFAIEDAERAAQTGHSTSTQAAGVARDAAVRLLALNHLSIRYPASVIRDEARDIFPNTVLPRDFDTIEIPFAERGEPELQRWSERDPGGALPLSGAPATAAHADATPAAPAPTDTVP
ncbi:MAG TPA: ribonuclease Z [Solirubrobacteraceae bacterium]|nr:ribonuclease Z [Solirubrobacteraceae bacterium]